MQRLSRLGVLSYSMGSLGAGLYWAFNSFALPLFLSLYTQNAILIGWLSSARSLEQFFIQPVVGAYSDSIWTRVGRRAPFFLIGMPISALFLAITGNIPHDPAYLWFAVGGVFLFSLFFNVGIDPYVALLADATQPAERGTVNGIAALFNLVGQVVLIVAATVLLEKQPALVFYLIGAGLIVGFGIVALGVHEKRDQSHHEPEGSRPRLRGWRKYLRERWKADPDAVKLLIAKLVYQIGINAAMPFLTLFVKTALGTNGWSELVGGLPTIGSSLAGMDADQVALAMGAILILMTAIFALPVGILGDYFGKKRIFALGLLVMGTCGLLAAFATSIPQLIVYLVFIGFGNAAQSVLFFPYLSVLIDPNRAGEYQGLAAAAETGGVVISILLAGTLINLNLFGLEYRLVFVLTGIFLLLGFLAVLPVRPTRPASAAEMSNLESIAA